MQQPTDPLIQTRATLLQRLKNWQDQASWQDFFDTYWRLIYGVARKAGMNDAEAQDVVQETMFAVAKHIPTFQYDPKLGTFKAWLLNMTRWRILDQFRRRRSGQAASSHDSETGTAAIERIPDTAAAQIDQIWEAEWRENLLAAALDNVKRRMEPQKYQIFDFYVNKEWAPDKVAQSFGISIDQVYLAKHRITEALKLEVERLEKQMA